MTLLDLSPDELLSTTRSVRKRLDFERPVEREVLDECLALAQQAPNASNSEPWRFVVVTEAGDPGQARRVLRDGLGRLPQGDRRAVRAGRATRRCSTRRSTSPTASTRCRRWCCRASCRAPTPGPSASQAGHYGSVIQAAWSFQLAARARGLGTCWTTLHLARERDAAEILGIPYERVQQVALITVGYSLGTDFKPGRRVALERVVRYERWR